MNEKIEFNATAKEASWQGVHLKYKNGEVFAVLEKRGKCNKALKLKDGDVIKVVMQKIGEKK